MLNRRCLLALLFAVSAMGAVEAQPSPDPLPSWNDGAIKKSITDFVTRVTAQGGADFVPIQQRIATFDNDGTLWCEQPAYFQLVFAFDRIKAMAPQHPEWKTTQPFKAILDKDVKALAASGEKAQLQILAATHTGMTIDEFSNAVLDWTASARHPRFNRPYTQIVYQPMLELPAYLRANDFKTFVVSGGGVEFMRPWMEKIYGIPPEQVVGSSGMVKFQMGSNGRPELMKLPRSNSSMTAGQAGRHQPLHRAAADLRIRKFRRRSADAAMDRRRRGRALRRHRAPHRCGARIRLRPSIEDRQAR